MSIKVGATKSAIGACRVSTRRHRQEVRPMSTRTTDCDRYRSTALRLRIVKLLLAIVATALTIWRTVGAS